MLKKEKKQLKRLERLSWFSPKSENETLEKDGFVYFKHWDGNKNRWTVSQFTKQSWLNMKNVSLKNVEKMRQKSGMQRASEELEQKYLFD